MTERYTIPAKPTVYRGVRFRSRLEAQWAHLFDQIEMPWEYEPLYRDGWLPDFRLWGRFLVEVKPIAPSGFAMASGDFDLISKAISGEAAILLGDGPGDNFGCLVSAHDGMTSARTFFYDPCSQFLMRSVLDDGGTDPARGNLQLRWRAAVSHFSEPSPSERISMKPEARRNRRSMS